MPERGALIARGTALCWGERTFVMGIVNVTPDSFSGDGRSDPHAAIERATHQIDEGADVIDIGGESTRPGHETIDDATEIARIEPVVRGVRARHARAMISIDSYKPSVVRAAHAAGADVVNSVWGISDALLDVVAELGMPIVAMHNAVTTHYDGDVVDAVVASLDASAHRALARGIACERIVLDPGIGFGKTAEDNVRVLAQLSRIVALGFPTLLGASRKSTIGRLTDREPHERLFGTAATTALAIAAGFDMIRVHDVAANRDVARVADAIVRGWRPPGWTA